MVNERLRPIICLTTHDRIDCAKINQEIIKFNYLQPLNIVHACSNRDYSGYIEDLLIRCEPKRLHEGAINLIQRAIKGALEYFDWRYLVHLESDTWLLDEDVLYKYIALMEEDEEKLISTCYWQGDALYFSRFGTKEVLRNPVRLVRKHIGLLGFRDRKMRDFCTQFFIIKRNPKLIQCILDIVPDPQKIAEEQVYDAFIKVFDLKNTLRMKEREPVNPRKRYFCEEMSLYCQHWPTVGTSSDPRPETDPFHVDEDLIGKKEALLRYPKIRKGRNIQKLLTSSNFDYYNPGAKRY